MRLLNYREASKAAGGLSQSSLRRLIAEGRFPRPVTLSVTKRGTPARVAFVESEVLAAVDRIVAEARGDGVSPSAVQG